MCKPGFIYNLTEMSATGLGVVVMVLAEDTAFICVLFEALVGSNRTY